MACARLMKGNVFPSQNSLGKISNSSNPSVNGRLLNNHTHQVNFNRAHSQANFLQSSNRSNIYGVNGYTQGNPYTTDSAGNFNPFSSNFLPTSNLPNSFKSNGKPMLMSPQVIYIPSLHQRKIPTENQ